MDMYCNIAKMTKRNLHIHASINLHKFVWLIFKGCNPILDMCQVSWKSDENRIFHHMWAVTMATHFLSVEKCFVLIYILRQTFIMNSMRIGWAFTKQFCHEHFALYFAHNMATYFQVLFKDMSCTSTRQGTHLCQVSWKSGKNWGSSL